MNAPIPANEAARLAALKSCAILDTPPESAFDDLVQLAARICAAPMAAVSLVDSERQWFKARVGIKPQQTSRNNSICAHAIAQEQEMFVVPDAQADKRFAHMPLVHEEPHIRFYTGVRLATPDGHVLGMLCVLDQTPRELTESQMEGLRILARQVVAQLELRKAHRRLEERVRERTAALQNAHDSLKRVEREASEWRKRYDLIVTSAGLAVYDIDRVTGDVFWSNGAEQVLGPGKKALNPASGEWLELIHPDNREAVMRCIESAMTNGRSFNVQYRLHQGMDHYRWIQDQGFVVPDSQGRCARVVGLMQDITQRKLAEDTMQEQAMLLDQTQDAIMVRDLTNHILYWNQTATKLYGWTMGEVLGKASQELLLHGDLGEMPRAHEIALKTGKWSGEVKVFSKAGKELTINSRWTLLRDRDGKPYAFLVAHTDLTESKLLEAKFFRAQRLESVGALASGIAHDLNNVFTPILMTAQLLRDPLDDTARAKMLDLLLNSARRGSEMVKQVLTFGRGLEGGPALVQIKHLLGELEPMLRDTFPRNIKIERLVSANLQLVRGDATQLYQVLMNLCINARDAMPDGGTLRVEAANVELNGQGPENNRGPHVCIIVADTGTGMPPEVQQKIFEPFFTTKEVGKGTGLGLSTVLSLVKAHGGFVELESKVGVGTKFKIFLPAEPVQTAEPSVAPKELPGGNGELLLVVDDESTIREIVKTALEAHGYAIMLAEEGTEALALYAANREKVALIITDIAMPVLDGHATIRALRKMNPEVKVIAASGVREPSEMEQLSRGGITVVPKPYSPENLLTAIHKVLHPEHN